MDESILTPEQRVSVAGLRVLQNMRPTQIIADDTTVEDVIRMVKNREFESNGIEGIRLVESQV